jgi:hypothetical protein
VGRLEQKHLRLRGGKKLLAMLLSNDGSKLKKSPMPARSDFKNMTGMIFTDWKVLRYAGKTENGGYFWWCKCKCGNEAVVDGGNLRSGRSKRCLECCRVTHGMHHDELYDTWLHMIQRCENENNQSYHNYGGRGIKVCQRWHDIKEFLKDVSPKPTGEKRYTLDRIDNDLNYSCGICNDCKENGWDRNWEWATYKTQMRHKRGNRLITIDGQTKTLAEWSEISGIRHDTIAHRIKSGMDEKSAIFKPKDSFILITIDGETKTLMEWSRISKIDHHIIRNRLKSGWDEKSAIFESVNKKYSKNKIRNHLDI